MGDGTRNISELLNRSGNTAATVVRRYRKSHTANDRRCSGCFQKIMPRTISYLCTLALKTDGQALLNWRKKYLWKVVFVWLIRRYEGYCVRSDYPRGKPPLTKWNKTERLNFAMKRGRTSVGSTLFGIKPNQICLDPAGSSVSGLDLAETIKVLTVKHGVGSVLISGIMGAKGSGQMNASAHSPPKHWMKRWISVARSSAREEFSSDDSDPEKHCNKSHKIFIRRKIVKTITLPSVSPVFRPTEHPWSDKNPCSKEQLKRIIRKE